MLTVLAEVDADSAQIENLCFALREVGLDAEVNWIGSRARIDVTIAAAEENRVPQRMHLAIAQGRRVDWPLATISSQ